jgi:hypothetical protein
MSPTDLPRQIRSLAHEARSPARDRMEESRRLPDYRAEGAAREPAVLLAELRLRLSRLPENHPSATVEPSRAGRDSDWPSAGVVHGAERGDADAESGPSPEHWRSPEHWQGARPEGHPVPDGRPESEGRPEHEGRLESEGRPDAEGRLEPDRSPDDALAGRSDTLPGPRGQLDLGRDWLAMPPRGGHEVDSGLGRLAEREAYRPWFMAADPAAPWFAVD